MEQRREEARRKREEEEQRRLREQEMRREFQTEKQREREEIVALEKQLDRERRERASAEKQKDEEIARLQAELARLHGTPAPSPSVRSSGAPSSGVPSVVPTPAQPSPHPPGRSRQQAEDLVRSLLGATLQSIDTVAHGPEEQRRNLDAKTRDSLDTNSQEYKDAEIELFGRELEADDWDGMEEGERTENTKKLMTRLKEKRDERLNETGT